MPSVSKAQQRFMGMVHAAQKGETPASPEVAKVAKDMSDKDAKDFASTSHKGLPNHVKKEILTRLRNEYAMMAGNHQTKPAAPAQGLADKVNHNDIDELRNLSSDELQEDELEDINHAVIPAALKIRFEKALEYAKGTNLNYSQKLRLLAKIIDSLGIDKSQLSRISTTIKTKLD
jgi:hypothetical protein